MGQYQLLPASNGALVFELPALLVVGISDLNLTSSLTARTCRCSHVDLHPFHLFDGRGAIFLAVSSTKAELLGGCDRSGEGYSNCQSEALRLTTLPLLTVHDPVIHPSIIQHKSSLPPATPPPQLRGINAPSPFHQLAATRRRPRGTVAGC